ncbi:unnamed protein product [Strongylus vulgaris]|uniref:RWD domain-containing protein n=1 Tax=Strongylus vulgaris TaxID=40348 RepID=A0A3P7L5P5_STRVU|nr:unnamed protein product [Strongylus vulgaris]
MDDSNHQAQLDEKVAIESIYGEDAVFGKTTCEVWNPLNVTVHLEPQHTGDDDSRVYVSLDLNIRCGKRYPTRSPVLSVIRSRGLSNAQIENLYSLLEGRCEELVGNPMIMEICELARTFLSDNNKPPQGSFHEIMLRDMENQDFLFKIEKETREAREKEAVAEELERQKLEAELRSEQGNEKKDVNVEGKEKQVSSIPLINTRFTPVIPTGAIPPQILPAEVRAAIQTMKAATAPGSDHISAGGVAGFSKGLFQKHLTPLAHLGSTYRFTYCSPSKWAVDAQC